MGMPSNNSKNKNSVRLNQISFKDLPCFSRLSAWVNYRESFHIQYSRCLENQQVCSVHSQFASLRVYVYVCVRCGSACVSGWMCACVFVSRAEEECIGGGGARLRVVRVSPTSLAQEPRASLTQ